MSNALKRQRGFSLPETVLAMALMVLTVTVLRPGDSADRRP